MAGETTTDKRIRVYLDTKIAGQEEFKKFSDRFQDLGNTIKGGEKTFKKLDKYSNEAFQNIEKGKFFDRFTKELGVNQQQVSKIMSTQGLHFNEFGNVVDMAGRKVKNIGDVMSEGYKKAKPFRFEFLSVMFAGMALNRVFGNLNKTAIEWTGINEIMSMTAGDLMLPAMLDLLDLAILPLSDAFMSMPDSMKEVIGWMSILGQGAGIVVSSVGQIGLALMGFEKLASDEKIKSFSTKLSSIWNKVDLKKTAQLGLSVVSAQQAVQDISEGEYLSAIGDAMFGAGLWVKDPKVGGILVTTGILLKVIGDDAIMNKLGEITGVIGTWATNIGGLIGSALRGDISGIAEYISKMEGSLAPKIDSFNQGLIEGMVKAGDLEGAQQELTQYHSKLWSEFEKRKSQGEKAAEVYEDMADKFDFWNKKIEEVNNGLSLLPEKKKTEYTIDIVVKQGALAALEKYGIKDLIKNKLSSIELFNKNKDDLVGGRAVGGTIGTTGPYLLHSGEQVISKQNNSSSPIINVTYNVSVSDKREFEAMLEKNNRQLTMDVRRYIA
jgi:hypothetical protein